MSDRFVRWTRNDDGPKETYLAEVGGSYVDDEVALAYVNANHASDHVRFTTATVRGWTRDDPEFALALRAAHRLRQEARNAPAPKQGPTLGFDENTDPFRVAFDVNELLGRTL